MSAMLEAMKDGAMRKQIVRAGEETVPVMLRQLDRLFLQIRERVLAHPEELRSLKETPEVVKLVVAAFYQVTLVAIDGRSHTARMVEPRHVAIYLTRVLTDMSLEELGKAFRKHRGLVSHAVSGVKFRMQQEPQFAIKVNELMTRVTMELARRDASAQVLPHGASAQPMGDASAWAMGEKI